MKLLVRVLLGFLGCISLTHATGSCPYSCTKKVSYSTNCGWWLGSHRCTKYKTAQTTCYRSCVHGGWSSWSVSYRGSCNSTCGGGVQSVTYRRSCTNPRPTYCCNSCSGSSTESRLEPCNTQPCCENGSWSDWKEESRSSCSKTCGNGTQTVNYSRSCDNPRPQHCGYPCSGPSSKTQQLSCNTQNCPPVDGGWGAWADWQDYDECRALCGGGSIVQWRMRTCDKPAQYDGGNCVGPDRENRTADCNTDECGDRCPEGETTFIANSNNNRRYYVCDNGVARLMECAAGTVWNQDSTACVHDGSQMVPEHPETGDARCDPTITYHAHEDCSKYVWCVGGVAHEMSCAPGTRFNPDSASGLPCDLADNVPCPGA